MSKYSTLRSSGYYARSLNLPRLGLGFPSQMFNGWPNHNIIIGSDFDHGDAVATWPRTVDVIKQMKNLSEVDKEKILGGNAMKMFGLNGNSTAKH